MNNRTDHVAYFDVLDYQSGLTKEVFQSWLPNRRFFLGNSDKDLTRYSRSNLLDYEVFFGRFSISQLDFLGAACKRVTVLEPPPLRIVNSYIRLRDQGMRARELGQPLGPHDFRSLASELQLDEFLGSGSGAAQAQIRAVFDNFYTYFFGTRNAYGRQLIKEVNALP